MSASEETTAVQTSEEAPQKEDTAAQEEVTVQASEEAPKEDTTAQPPEKEDPAAPPPVVAVEEEEEEEEEEPDDGVPRVLVTGASGYIATHLIKSLLEQGRLRIRGTVRSKKNKEKIQPLLDLCPNAKYPLRLIEADLNKPESWAKAVKSCSYVFHLASPFPPGKVKPQDEEEQLYRPAKQGTISVLQACADAKTVKRVILTSSIAAVSSGLMGNPGKPQGYVYTEADFSDEDSCLPYERSKTKAETAAWEFMKNLEEDKKFELVVVNPGYVQGPLLSVASGGGSKALCVGLLSGKVPAILDINFALVDVRDVAAAHIAAMEKPEAAGNRYILFDRTLPMREVADILRNEFKPQGFNKVPSMALPKIGMWVFKLFDDQAKNLYPQWGKEVTFDNTKMVRELGVSPRPSKESLIDMCYTLIEFGEIRKAPGYLGPPSTREAKPDPKPADEAVSDPKPADEAEPKPANEADPKPADEAEPKPADEANPKPADEAEPKPTDEANPKPADETESKPADEAEPDPKPADETEPDSKPADETEPDSKPADETEPDSKPADESA